jgi:hypothetical protein
MGFVETMIFYHLIGLGVAASVFLSDPGRGALTVFRVSTGVVFWPLYLPILLAGPKLRPRLERRGASPGPSGGDAMSEAISRVESELEAALAGLDGWAEDVLARETHRLGELGHAWRAQAERVREIDRLLAAADRAEPEPDPTPDTASDRCRKSEQTRRANLERLRQVRVRAYEELMGTLAWVRELVSMIHLAKFTGAPASRAGELVAQIAAAVEGISAVAWHDEPNPTGPTRSPEQPFEETFRCESSAASATSSPRT